ncbi:Cobalt-zinc-cadmium resistance protein [Methanosarcina horonobensis HB-1 = JCM 15518]|uniref:Cobalt-zinc-cadmium resistance protein n=1 Tax=Methanosarcina horonobensis HB-1 = JCM 15518 TaxID=1434110 RepID=A0A0E3S8M1_9EURY|nr:cation diffusion facilitator family transporter [Methanosarcina horonobensis]AKB76976.1 Cobalt-zinc-cadmium resistance protein [Methanosarcina horonobensis HB-1 = JCM 15518]
MQLTQLGPGNSREEHSHSHAHGVVDPELLSTDRGLSAVKWSFTGLIITALFQILVVWISGSVALLADTIHNFGDAATAIPLGFAFLLSRKRPDNRFTYGYGRAEDLAGLLIVFLIFLSAAVAAYESVSRLISPQPVDFLWAVAAASIIGFLGNELVAKYRIRIGKEIGSAALIADGYHARADGFTSLAVLFGALGVWLGYPLADPIIGLLITVAILHIVWDAGKSVFSRMLDGVDPDIVDEIRQIVSQVKDVKDITEVRVRWLGHRLYAEVNIAVDSGLSVKEGHEIAVNVRHTMLHGLDYLSNAVVHVDPLGASGEIFHRLPEHELNAPHDNSH